MNSFADVIDLVNKLLGEGATLRMALLYTGHAFDLSPLGVRILSTHFGLVPHDLKEEAKDFVRDADK